MAETVLVTETEYRRAEDVFGGAGDVACAAVPADEAALADAVTTRDVRAVVVGVQPYRGPLYAALGRRGGGLIARFGVGHDNIDKVLARAHQIVVTNTPGVLDVSVAEHTLWLIGCLAKQISRQDARLRSGQFAGQTGSELQGRTLGLLGWGNIARRVAAMAHFGFGLRVLAAGRRSPADWEAQEGRPLADLLAAAGVERYTTAAEELFRASDILSIHLPANAENQRFVNAQRLAWLKPAALLVNTARGAVLDEAALYDALAGGQLAGAALDVFAVEPYQPVHPDKDLRQLENVVLTPHIGSNTRAANQRMATACLTNVRHFLAGQWDQLTQVTA